MVLHGGSEEFQGLWYTIFDYVYLFTMWRVTGSAPDWKSDLSSSRKPSIVIQIYTELKIMMTVSLYPLIRHTIHH